MEFTQEELTYEIWKDILDYEDIYQVSSLGRVRSLNREEEYYIKGTKCKRFRKGTMLNIEYDIKGYCRVRLRNKEHTKKMFVHRLVAFAFIPNDNLENNIINHKDNTPSNNIVENLEWCNQKYNIQYKFTNNNYSHKGSNHPQSKITEDIAEQIYTLGHSGEYTNIELANKFNVSKHIINNIKTGHTWSHITEYINIDKKSHPNARGHKIKSDRGEEFNSIAEAASYVGVAPIGIRKCLNGKRYTSAGRTWTYC